jgi:hypothetical protein
MEAPMTATTTPLDTRSTSRSPQHAAAVAVLVLLVVALVGRTVFLLWEPPFDGAIRYDDVAPLGDAYWTMHIALGGPAFAITWVATAILTSRLARGRSAGVTIAGAMLTGFGGIVFALVVTAEVLPFAYAADPAVLTEAEGRALFVVLNEHIGRVVPWIVGSQAAVAAGVLVVLITSLATRALPRGLAVAGLAYLVVFAVVPLDALPRAVVVISDLLQSAIVLGLGWYGFRAGRAGR